MKATKVLITTICACLFCMKSHAQFNTIGTAYHKPIKTVRPSKSQQTLTDSIVISDSIPESMISENIGKQEQDNLTSNLESGSVVALPLKNIHIGSGYGQRMHPIYHKRMMHNGIDISARYENVYSMFPGTVIRVGEDNRSGKYVTVKTGDFAISYCHLSVPYVHSNDYVDAGTPIACSGNTGASTGPHLHITTKKDGKAFDPTILLDFILKSY